MIYILGAGIAGLSSAFHLKGKEYRIVEKEKEVGGLCKTVAKEGFTFDYSGHLLTTRAPYTRRLMDILMPDGLLRYSRRSAVYVYGRFIPFPFQAHLGWLPKEIAKECLTGFIEASIRSAAKASRFNGSTGQSDFMAWIYKTFGRGIAEHFMIPYNKKVWGVELNSISDDWVSWSVPMPTLEDVLKGAMGIVNRDSGYSSVFYYPKIGGIHTLCQGMSRYVDNIQLDREVKAIRLDKSTISFQDGKEGKYSALINTMPLPELLKRIEDLPKDLADMSQDLRHVSVLVLNLGVERSDISPYHWVYFPEAEFPFYRVGFYANFSRSMVPSGCSSLYIEVSHLPGEKMDLEGIRERVLKGLIVCGILKEIKEVIVTHEIDIGYAYVIHDEFRRFNLPVILDYLAEKEIFSIGRYGRWHYCTMEDTILQGKEAAEELNRRG